MTTEVKKDSGWRTKAGGVGLILTGLAGLLGLVATGTFSFESALVAAGTIASGLVAVGLGGKAEKLLEAIRSLQK